MKRLIWKKTGTYFGNDSDPFRTPATIRSATKPEDILFEGLIGITLDHWQPEIHETEEGIRFMSFGGNQTIDRYQCVGVKKEEPNDKP